MVWLGPHKKSTYGWLENAPTRRHAVEGRNHFAFSDVRRSIAKTAMGDCFSRFFPVERNSVGNSLAEVLLRMVA